MNNMGQDMTDAPVDFDVESGNTGLNRIDGWIIEEQLHDLKGKRGVKKFREMSENDPTAGAALFAIEMLCRQARFYIKPSGDTDADKQAADFLDGCLFKDMEHTFQEMFSDILSMLTFGWAYFEMVFKKRMGDTGNPETQSIFDDGKVGFRKISIRAQETLFKWEFDDNNNLIGMWQMSPPKYNQVFIPYEKSLNFRYKNTKDNPEGYSILRNAYEPYYYKTKLQKIEGIGIERDMAGLPFATVPAHVMSPSANTDEKATLTAIKKMIKNVRQDKAEGIVFPAAKDNAGQETGYSFSLLTSGGKRNFDTDKTITRYEQRIAQTMQADFIFLGQTGTGSYALSADKTDLFSMAIGTILDTVCQTFNSRAIPLLFKLNAFTGLSGLPTLEHDPIEPPDILKLAQFMQALSASGATLFPNDQLLNHLLKLAGLPEIPEETLKAMAAQRQQQSDMLQSQIETQKAQANALAANSNQNNNNQTGDNGAQVPDDEQINKFYQSVKKNDQNAINDLKAKLEDAAKVKLSKAFQDSLDELLDKAEDIGVTQDLLDFIEDNDLLNDAVESALKDAVGDFYGVGWNTGSNSIKGAANEAGVTVNMSSMDAAKNLQSYMEDRGAAVLSGMEETTTTLVRNCISDSLSNEEDFHALSDRLKSNYAFSPSRAECVSRTESAVGYNTGFAKIGKESKCVKGLMVTDLAECGCQECIDANGEFPCGWLIDNPIAHPNCTRDATYVYDFGNDIGNNDDDEDD